MDIVIIEDQPIIADSIRSDFSSVTFNALSITILSNISEVRLFDYSKTKYIVSDLCLGSSVYETFIELFAVKSTFPDISISIFTQANELPLLPALLTIINADHLFNKCFDREIARTVLFEPVQSFKAPKSQIRQAEKLLNLDKNTQSIFSMLASHNSVTTIAIEKQRSKSAISQAVRKAELNVGSKEKLMRLFQIN